MHREAFYLLLSLSFWDVPFWAFLLFLFMTVESYEWGTFSDWIKLGHKGNSILYLRTDFLVGYTVWPVWNRISYELSSQSSFNLILKKGFFLPLSSFFCQMVMQNIIYFPYELSLIKLKGNYILSRIRCEVTRIWK